MYYKNNKRRVYWLIDQYLTGKIDELVFCDEFYYSYGLSIDRKLLTKSEAKNFQELDKVASRFFPYEEDHKLDERAYFSKEDLAQKILDVKNALNQ